MLNIIGGTYFESCIDPSYNELFGSGLRGAIALSGFNVAINFYTLVGQDAEKLLEEACLAYKINLRRYLSQETFTFYYYHPLSRSYYFPETIALKKIALGSLENVLMYGLLEGDFEFKAKSVVYDPQNGRSFSSTGAVADKLAYVLNRNEAVKISKLPDDSTIDKIIEELVRIEGANIVIVKDSVFGAYVWDGKEITPINFYRSDRIWPIGSGDVFASVFAYNWLIKRLMPKEAAINASLQTSNYCNSKLLPLVENLEKFPISIPGKKRIYLAGPFFSISDRWVINEALQALQDFRQDVFSPFHSLGVSNDFEIAKKDLQEISSCDVVLAILNVLDSGTLFEIGYARAQNKEVVIFSETISERDLFMLVGSECKLIDDFATAIYIAAT
ncbi:nucleoside 2-deoxyribosyltransferase [Algoriphagus halophytocola]|uniref:nucleoside 2-deoxyribosyltransferase n=1 Tax=Algoriphagus halophytocola TaxID=2991499 RepID=UPI0022DDDCC6|nr:nucleoside 2-deoxyribosyltransferase [Algoriphagus sp. TR-M9]WBL43551.1 nucleoside 2-deoxyribosyltransferase [Algoriphagus sp. TR-M9]